MPETTTRTVTEPTLADLAAHSFMQVLWQDNPDRPCQGVTTRAVLAAGIRRDDLMAFKAAVAPNHHDDSVGAIALTRLTALIDPFPTMTVHDAMAWVMVAEQAWTMTVGAVHEFEAAGFGYEAWRFLAAGLTAAETVQIIADNGGDVPWDDVAFMMGLRGTVVPRA